MEPRLLLAYALIGLIVLACAAIVGTWLWRRARERKLWRGGARRKR
jgi:hypothetical protein